MLSGNRPRRRRTGPKKSILQRNPAIEAGRRRRPERNPDQDVADLTNSELPRLNRFSKPHRHSDVPSPYHDRPASTAVTSFRREISVRGSLPRAALLPARTLTLSPPPPTL